MVESTPILEWKHSKKTLVAKLPDGELQIAPDVGGYDLWFYRSGEWGTNNFLGTFLTEPLAQQYAKEWVGDAA